MSEEFRSILNEPEVGSREIAPTGIIPKRSLALTHDSGDAVSEDQNWAVKPGKLGPRPTFVTDNHSSTEGYNVPIPAVVSDPAVTTTIGTVRASTITTMGDTEAINVPPHLSFNAIKSRIKLGARVAMANGEVYVVQYLTTYVDFTDTSSFPELHLQVRLQQVDLPPGTENPKRLHTTFIPSIHNKTNADILCWSPCAGGSHLKMKTKFWVTEYPQARSSYYITSITPPREDEIGPVAPKTSTTSLLEGEDNQELVPVAPKHLSFNHINGKIKVGSIVTMANGNLYEVMTVKRYRQSTCQTHQNGTETAETHLQIVFMQLTGPPHAFKRFGATLTPLTHNRGDIDIFGWEPGGVRGHANNPMVAQRYQGPGFYITSIKNSTTN